MANYTRIARYSLVGWDPSAKGGSGSVTWYRAKDLTFSPERMDVIDGSDSIGLPTKDIPRVGGRYTEIGFTSEIRPSSADAAPPPEGALMRSCGFDEDADGVDFNYLLGNLHATTDATAGDLDLVDISIDADRLKYIAPNCVGDMEADFTAARIPFFKWTFRGNVAALATAATTVGHAEVALGTLTAGANPTACRVGSSITIDPAGAGAAYSPVIEYIRIKLNNEIDPRPDLNTTGGYAQPRIMSRNPEVSIAVEADLIANWDPVAEFLNQRNQVLAFVHNNGGSAREQLTISFNGTISEPPAMENHNGRLVWAVKMVQTPGSAELGWNWD